MDRTKRILCAFLALLFAAAGIAGSVFASKNDSFDGELSRVYRRIADGADFAGYVLGEASGCGAQEFSTVTFDCEHYDLRFDVAAYGGEPCSPATAIADRFCAGKTRVAAAFAAGDELDGYTVVDREIVCAGDERSAAFGVTCDGAAIVGEISFSAQIKNRQTGESVIAKSVNTPPAKNGIAIYTDFVPTDIQPDAEALALDVGYDFALIPGEPIEGKIASISLPGKARPEAGPDRLIIVCRGTAIGSGDFRVGDLVTLTPDISDSFGNTALWRTANAALSGKATLLKDGSPIADGSFERSASGVIGVRPDGSAMMLASYGGRSNYSLGFTRGELAKLCSDLSITDAILLCEGDSVEMIAAGEDGALHVTGRPSGKEFAPVAVSIVLSVPDENASLVLEEYEERALEIPGVRNLSYSLKMLEKNTKRDDRAPLAVPEKSANDGAANASLAPQPYEAAANVGDLYIPINSLYKQLEFDSTGEWLTLVIKKSDLEAWYGKIYRGENA